MFAFPCFHALTLLTLLAGCSVPRPLRGGHAITTGPVHQTLTQGENPSVPSRQTQDVTSTRIYSIPSFSSRLVPPKSDEGASEAQAPGPFQPSAFSLQPSPVATPPILVTEQTSSHATTELGAAQKDTARELTAKLSSLKGIVWVGLALFIFGIASLFWPPLKAIIGSVTTSAAITVGGLALIILPTLIVGNELLILGGVVLVVGGWFLAHRHGQLRGLADRQVLADPQSSGTAPAPGVPVGTPPTGSTSK